MKRNHALTTRTVRHDDTLRTPNPFGRAARFARTVTLLSLLALAVGVFAPSAISPVFAAGTTAGIETESDNRDPFERFNRSVYRFNERIDRAVLKPLAIRYVEYVPPTMRKGVNNFVSNLREPTTIVNDLLQGKFKQAGKDGLRFVINTTFGLLGVLDIATSLKLERNREDFGQTMGKWGVPSGPYLVLPLLGPSNIRDAAGLVPQYAYTDLTAGIDDDGLLWTIFAARAIDTRAGLLKTDKLLGEQIDPYVFVRESYRQRRLNDIHDGQLPAAEDEFLDEILNEDG
ncbi:MAG: VacJ family lipoprotein [Proteobacteria bacterium]|nr:MAG: VacJ family lipoprotein [Pseudomonadota bacterium]